MQSTKVGLAVLFALIISSVPGACAAGCSNASIKGTYGIVSQGSYTLVGPVASLFRVTLDGAGHLSGTATESINGGIVTSPVTGTYSIAANCTGTAAVMDEAHNVANETIVLNNRNSKGIFAGAFLIQTDPDYVLTSVALLKGAATCSDRGVRGPFSFTDVGTNTGIGPVAAAGRFTLNGTGSLTGTETLSLDGLINSSLPVTGTYSINSNCTGTATFTPQGQSTVNLALVVVNGGREILAIETDNNTVVTGTFQR